MTPELDFQVRWLERRTGSPAEREAFGEVEIRWGDVVLTELLDVAAATVRPAARLSVLHLGTWLAANWWRLRWEPLPPDPDADWRVAHQVGGAGGGFAWPALELSADGETVALTLRETYAEGAPVRYLRRAEGAVDAASFERAVDDLMSKLLARLATRGVEAPELEAAWGAVLAEREDADEAARRRREALLGLDPDEISGEELDAVLASGTWMGEAALDEVLALARAPRAEPTIAELKHRSAEPGPELDLGPILEVAEAWRAASPPPRQPWQRGVDLARRVREAAGLSPDEPVSSVRLADLLGHDVTSGEPGGGSLAAGFRSAEDAHRLRFHGVRRHATSRRFEAARLLADFIDGNEADRVLPVTDARTARQKVQRAFAQELLCPVDALAAMVRLPSPTDAELERVADHFGVSELTVRSALVNRGLVDRQLLLGHRVG